MKSSGHYEERQEELLLWYDEATSLPLVVIEGDFLASLGEKSCFVLRPLNGGNR